MKRRKLWVTPAILMFGAEDSEGKQPVQHGSACGESVIRYGESCGIRNYGHCRPRNVQDCSPAQIGSQCYPGRQPGQCVSGAPAGEGTEEGVF